MPSRRAISASLLATSVRQSEARPPHAPAETLGVLEVVAEPAGVDEQLLRHAAADDAGAAEPILLGDPDPGAVLGGHARRPNAARAAADHEKVEVEFAHPRALSASPGRSASARFTNSGSTAITLRYARLAWSGRCGPVPSPAACRSGCDKPRQTPPASCAARDARCRPAADSHAPAVFPGDRRVVRIPHRAGNNIRLGQGVEHRPVHATVIVLQTTLGFGPLASFENACLK